MQISGVIPFVKVQKQVFLLKKKGLDLEGESVFLGGGEFLVAGGWWWG